MKNKTILIIEDEKRLSDLLCDYLCQAGYTTDCLYEGQEAVARVRANQPALILLDLMLPGKDGLDICKEIRSFSEVPIVMMTARVEEIDRLLGLELGADDYICKPFSPREVVARVKAVLRRSRGAVHSGRSLTLDNKKYIAKFHGEKLDLTAVEFQLLRILFEQSGRIFTRDQLMDKLYTDRRIVCDRTIDSHIKKLRKKIAIAAPGLEIIRSVYGVGYKYEGL
ncbi:response regulator [Desulfosediminicola ganghwensis]|uniref:response regulator n=1 Tax=Desulfosediminicola ganghwensis TaxID=2569540 RepID=UPI0010AD95AB|nr:response regulator [Desulfosediminicola ganghwensis]